MKYPRIMILKNDTNVSNEMIIMSSIIMPYATHNKSPIKCIKNMGKERPWTEPDMITLNTCGTKEMVVHIPPIKPTINEGLAHNNVKSFTFIYFVMQTS